MADDTTMTPVEGAEPPKANPLAKPAASSSTLKLKPVERTGLPSGLKLPPKPGLATAGLKLPPKPGLASGLKLPPKPGLATQTGLKLPPKPGLASGLKLPPKPGLATQTGLKPAAKPLATAGLAPAGKGLATKPVIRKPGSTLPLTRPTLAGLKKPVSPAAPEAPTVPAAAPAAAAPAAPAAAVAPAAPELTPVTPTEVSKVETSLDALKSATQNLKSVTAPVPQQAILRKTGILAESPSDVQKEAAKSKTSRISLSEAMGAAPVLNENAPMKTIRIKRPIDIPGVTKTEPPAAAAEPPAPVDTQASTVASESEAKPSVTLTQRKTLKISRPSGGVMRPSGKFGIKRPGTVMTSKTAAPKADEATPPADAAAKNEGDVPEIADIPSLPAAPVPSAPAGEPDLPKAVSIIGLLVQAAACVAMGALAWWLYTDTQILPF